MIAGLINSWGWRYICKVWLKMSFSFSVGSMYLQVTELLGCAIRVHSVIHKHLDREFRGWNFSRQWNFGEDCVPSLKTLVLLLCDSLCFVENNLSKVCHILCFKIGRLESSMANKKSIILISARHRINYVFVTNGCSSKWTQPKKSVIWTWSNFRLEANAIKPFQNSWLKVSVWKIPCMMWDDKRPMIVKPSINWGDFQNNVPLCFFTWAPLQDLNLPSRTDVDFLRSQVAFVEIKKKQLKLN